ncbi:related to DNA-directed DNA polymerase lambda [Cephalotrichum gorgonifer]|uniref:DNA-directed DNA polymerase n=1 Tax=Cephalotrichum gorgonifer TaxID=2041049 RepID=A0AAE8MPZ6_9PEZI|nr:related to DNA-directed DNA polymerase lambda [Cephalotrichum gorgonifer]
MASSEDPGLEDKIEYFRQLDFLTRRIDTTKTKSGGGSDSEGDSLDEEEEAFRRKCRRFHTKPNTPAATPGPPPSSQPRPDPPQPVSRSPRPLQLPAEDSPGGPPRRVVSAPLGTTIKATPTSEYRRRAAARDPDPDVSFVAETPIPVPDSAPGNRRHLLRRSETTPLPLKRSFLGRGRETAAAAPVGLPAMKKRKRGADQVRLVPEADRVCVGLRFYYIPNDDVAPARRARIMKAREYGAFWTREIGDATHVIVDRQLKYGDIEGILGAQPLSGGPPAVVNEDFPLDCIKFRHVLNPHQAKYQVAGYPGCEPAQKITEKPPDGKAGKEHLPLKPPPANSKRWDHIPVPDTQSQSSRGAEARLEPANPPSQQVISISDDESQQSQAPRSNHGQGQPDSPGAKAKPKLDAFGDELSGYINLMQEYKALPLDDDHEDDDLHSVSGTTVAAASSSSSSDEEEHRSGCSDEEEARRGPRNPKRKEVAMEERFACYQGGTREKSSASASSSPNARTIEVLQEMCTYYTRMNDQWRTISYRKAIKTLQRQPVKVRTADEARRLPNIGDRLARKIEEIAATDRLQRLEYANAEPLDRVLQLFLGVYDVGAAQAGKWIAQGHRTLEDLMAHAKLTRNQRLGVERYADMNARIPRREVEALADVVRRTAASADPDVEVIVGGSYRRGAESSGDVDFLITRKGTTSAAELSPFLDGLARDLEASGVLVARLAGTGAGGSGSKLHGCCVLPGGPPTWRRVDFLLVPEAELGAALLYFTGNDVFNRSMRLLASKKDMRLNQRGLYAGAMRAAGRQKISEGTLVEARDERRIFEALGVKWREPWERWC